MWLLSHMTDQVRGKYGDPEPIMATDVALAPRHCAPALAAMETEAGARS